MKLSKETKNILEEYGWTPDRTIDITKYVQFLESKGYIVFDIVRKFLIQFGELRLQHPHYVEPTPEQYTKYKLKPYKILHFNSIDAARGIFIENIKCYEERIGEKLTPIGEAHDGYLVLMISESGKMYGAFDDYLTLLGNSYEEGIEAIYQRLKTPEIPIKNTCKKI